MLAGAALALPSTASALGEDAAELDHPYVKRLEVHGVPILATEAVDDEYLYIAARVYDHMTSRREPFDLRALHRSSGFRILLIHPEESFLSLPEYAGEDEELDEAGGLGGSIGEFHVGLRVGSPHVLVHELGHGIYHSAIQFQETGGATDEEAWYRRRVKEVLGLDLDEVHDQVGEGEVHEVLLAPQDTFSADLAAAWRNAEAKGLWADDYAGSEPNEYWAEGVAMWFRSWAEAEGDSREELRERDPMLFSLCERIFPATDWGPSDAQAVSPHAVPFHDDESSPERRALGDPELGDLLEFLDRDRDGAIGAYEGAEAFLFLTREADIDRDDAISAFELQRFLGEAVAEEERERMEFFSELDQDGNGSLVPDELPEEMHGHFAAADADGDEQVSLDELLAFEEVDDPRWMFEQELLGFLREVDQDGDGAFSLDDLPAYERADFAEEFEELDANQDGRVDEGELLALLEEELRGAAFEVRGREAVMTGVIGPSTPGRVLELILEHPEVERIVMEEVPGSMDDHANLRAARLLRRHGLATHVPEEGEVASGGTDFFLAGVVRSRGAGARFGVHSWSGGPGEEGADVPRHDEEHVKYLEFYREMGIPEAFYWYTLEAAPADDIHWMTDEELERFGVLSDGARVEADEEELELLGGCVLREPRATPPSDLREVSAVAATKDYGPLPKVLRACGITLAAEAEVPDDFLERVGRLVGEVFEASEGVDPELQERVLTQLHAYRALLPVPRNESSFERLHRRSPEAVERLVRENSLCDIIMASVPEGQVMEVVEHILHAVTDVGLHYTFPEEWGLSRESGLWKTMQLAIERGHYVVDGYEDLRRHEPAEVYDRVLLQEFAYWFISTAWELQEPYGPEEAEWTIRDRGQLQELYPDFFAVYERTAARVMQAPGLEILAEIGPTRAEERGR